MAYPKVSKDYLKNLLHATKHTSFAKNTSIKTISKKLDQIFSQIDQIFDDEKM